MREVFLGITLLCPCCCPITIILHLWDTWGSDFYLFFIRNVNKSRRFSRDISHSSFSIQAACPFGLRMTVAWTVDLVSSIKKENALDGVLRSLGTIIRSFPQGFPKEEPKKVIRPGRSGHRGQVSQVDNSEEIWRMSHGLINVNAKRVCIRGDSSWDKTAVSFPEYGGEEVSP